MSDNSTPKDFHHETTVVSIDTCWWEHQRPDVTLSSIVNGQRRVAMLVAQLAQIDVLSISHAPDYADGLCDATVVYLSTRKTLEDIVQAVKPQENVLHGNWLILDVTIEFGMINVLMSFLGEVDVKARGL